MHHFIFPTQDTWISSGSSTITGETFKDQNFGKDQILEVKKVFYDNKFDYKTRALINFNGTEFNNLKQEIDNGNIPTDAKYYLRLYEAEGNSELSETYTLSAFPLYQSWTEGTGKDGDNPKNTNGVSWENRNNPIGSNETNWSVNLDSGSVEFNDYISLFIGADSTFSQVTQSDYFNGGNSNGGVWVDDVGFAASQSFDLQTPDVDMDITYMVNRWIDEDISNYGLILKFSGSQETDDNTFGHLKFFSRNTHTIYAPRLEVRWDDHTSATNDNTGSLTSLVVSGLEDNYLYMKALQESYKENDRVKFRVGARKRYIQKTFSTSVQSVTGSFIPEGKGFYAIKDVATDEFIVPFSAYTSMSCDSNSSYFTQWLDGFYPDRVYKILLKLKYDNGQEQIFDEDFEFTVKRK